MNLVGKIFTVLIFIISLVLMSLVLALYATHTNWRLLVENPPEKATEQNPTGYKYRLSDAENIKKNLESKLSEIQTELDREVLEKKQVKAKLETENEKLKKTLDEKEQLLVEKIKSESDAITQMKGVMQTLESMRSENDTLRKAVETITEDRDKQFELMVNKTDELHNKVNEYQVLQMRNKELADEYARAQQVLRHFGLENNPEFYAKQTPPENLEGRVLKISPDLVVISLGSDDGIRKGHQFDVSRTNAASGSVYVGRIEVVRADQPDQAICKILKDQQRNQFLENDRVKPAKQQ